MILVLERENLCRALRCVEGGKFRYRLVDFRYRYGDVFGRRPIA